MQLTLMDVPLLILLRCGNHAHQLGIMVCKKSPEKIHYYTEFKLKKILDLDYYQAAHKILLDVFDFQRRSITFSLKKTVFVSEKIKISQIEQTCLVAEPNSKDRKSAVFRLCFPVKSKM